MYIWTITLLFQDGHHEPGDADAAADGSAFDGPGQSPSDSGVAAGVTAQTSSSHE